MEYKIDFDVLKTQPAFVELTKKQQRFLRELADTQSPTKAAMLAFDCLTDSSARAMASKLLHHPAIEALLEVVLPSYPELDKEEQPSAPIVEIIPPCSWECCDAPANGDNNGKPICAHHLCVALGLKSLPRPTEPEQSAENVISLEELAEQMNGVQRSRAFSSTLVYGGSGTAEEIQPESDDPIQRVIRERVLTGINERIEQQRRWAAYQAEVQIQSLRKRTV